MAVYKSDANLVALWSLDESSGTRYDYTTNNNDLTDINSVGSSTAAPREGTASADFERNNGEYLTLTDASQTGLDITGSLSIGCWCKPESLTDLTSHVLVGKYNTSTSDRSYRLSLSNYSGNYYAECRLSNDGAAYTTGYGATAISAGTWVHLVAVYDGTDIRVYVNGALDSNGANNPKTYSSGIHNGGAPFRLGAQGNGTWLYDGLIDEAFVFNRALSAAEVAAIYSGGIEPGLSISTSSAITLATSVALSQTSSGTRAISVSNGITLATSVGLSLTTPSVLSVSVSSGVAVAEAATALIINPPTPPVTSARLGRSLRTGVRVVLYDQAGMPVAEIAPQIDSVVWRLNGAGSAAFKLAYKDSACRKLWLQPGARVLFEFENGLPDWGGVIDFPLRQDAYGVIVSAFSAEKILDLRRTGKSEYYANASPGAIYQALIESMNAVSPTGIDIGTIDAGGAQITLEFHLQNVWERVQELARTSGADFAILPVVNQGVLSFAAHWYDSRGVDRSSQVLLAENRNAQISALDWQGPVWNRITLAGEGSTWGTSRMTVTDEDVDSQASYGFREYAEVQSGVVDESTLTANAAALVASYAQPKKRISLVTLDQAPGLFANYDIGDIVRVQAFLGWPDWVLDDYFRVVAREWKPDGTCAVEVDEWA
jgi:hypothetical protein